MINQSVSTALYVVAPMFSVTKETDLIQDFVRSMDVYQDRGLDAQGIVDVFDETVTRFLRSRSAAEACHWQQVFARLGWEMVLALKGYIRPSTMVEAAAIILFWRYCSGTIVIRTQS